MRDRSQSELTSMNDYLGCCRAIDWSPVLQWEEGPWVAVKFWAFWTKLLISLTTLAQATVVDAKLPCWVKFTCHQEVDVPIEVSGADQDICPISWAEEHMGLSAEFVFCCFLSEPKRK